MAGKKDKVKDQDRFSIIYKDLTRCALCGKITSVSLHEVFFGTANRKKSKEDGMIAPLCWECHQGTRGVHNNTMLDNKLKVIGQQAWECKYMDDNNVELEEARSAFISRYGKNYIMDEDKDRKVRKYYGS